MKKILYGIIAVLGIGDLHGANSHSDRMTNGQRICEELVNLPNREAIENAFDSLNAEDKVDAIVYSHCKASTQDYVLTYVDLVKRSTPREEWAGAFAEVIAGAPNKDKGRALSLYLLSQLTDEELLCVRDCLKLLINISEEAESVGAEIRFNKNAVISSVEMVFDPLARILSITNARDIREQALLRIQALPKDTAPSVDQAILEIQTSRIAEEIEKEVERDNSQFACNLAIIAGVKFSPDWGLQLRSNLRQGISQIPTNNPVRSGLQLAVAHINLSLPYEIQARLALEECAPEHRLRDIERMITNEPTTKFRQEIFSGALPLLSIAEREQLMIELSGQVLPMQQLIWVSQIHPTVNQRIELIVRLMASQNSREYRQTMMKTTWQLLSEDEKDFFEQKLAEAKLARPRGTKKK